MPIPLADDGSERAKPAPDMRHTCHKRMGLVDTDRGVFENSASVMSGRFPRTAVPQNCSVAAAAKAQNCQLSGVYPPSGRGAEGLRSGKLAADDPQLSYDHSLPPVDNVRAMADGETLRLGDTVITAVATPGHTMGSMSWSWQSCTEKGCKNIVFASSLNPVSHDNYRYSDASSAGIVNGFRGSYARMKALPCDILVAAHRDNAFAADTQVSAGDAPPRYNSAPDACRAYAERSEARLNKRLAAGE